ncbi:hypothetical protein RND81_08G094000 [Saponaria officinalis]|uniref:Integrase catalytic domain-containing protein n=1 Tax=Saponaria officinalis TaxID=3572 RepID=A0AAW1J837_SAPOF
MKENICRFIQKCSICQKCKYDASAYPEKLQPLSIPNTIWTDISMDFIEGLPKSMAMDSIVVVVDRLSKSAHFIPLKHPYSAAEIAQAFFDNIYKLHGMPKTIVSDRDPLFLSNFWQELFAVKVEAVDRTLLAREEALQGIKLNLAKAQNRMKQLADKRRSEKEFAPGDYVLEKIGPVAYKLDLPPTAKIHPTFHVSLLKKCHGEPPMASPIPSMDDRSHVPELILTRKTVKRGRLTATKVLVKGPTLT